MVDKLKIGSIVIRCFEFEKLPALWKQALHSVHRYAWRYPRDDDLVVLEDPDGNLFCVVQVPA